MWKRGGRRGEEGRGEGRAGKEDLEEEIDGLMLSVVLHEVGDELVEEGGLLLGGEDHGAGRSLGGLLVVREADLEGEVAHVLVAPRRDRLLGALQLVAKRVALLGAEHHAEPGDEVSELRHGVAGVRGRERVVVGAQELERLGHRRHRARRAPHRLAQRLHRRLAHTRIAVLGARDHEGEVGLETSVFLALDRVKDGGKGGGRERRGWRPSKATIRPENDLKCILKELLLPGFSKRAPRKGEGQGGRGRGAPAPQARAAPPGPPCPWNL